MCLLVTIGIYKGYIYQDKQFSDKEDNKSSGQVQNVLVLEEFCNPIIDFFL